MTPTYAFSGSLPGFGDMTQVSYSCDNCMRFSVAWAVGATRHSTDLHMNDEYLIEFERTEWSPRIGVGVTFEDVPDHIASAASEAHECASIGAKRAAILMARSVIEASAKANSITKGTLYDKIGEMAKSGLLRQTTAQAAHGIRYYGNDMAHGDFDFEVTDDDVSETLNLMGVVLTEVFQVDAKTKSLVERYRNRKADAKVELVVETEAD